MAAIQRPTPFIHAAAAVGETTARSAAHNAAARSCITCAKAKAKCVRQSGQQVCERCTRLHKECQIKEPVQRRRKPAKLTRTAQLENLENKLHNLVHALSAQQEQQSQSQSQTEAQLQSQPRIADANGHPSPSVSQGVSEAEISLEDQFEMRRCDDFQTGAGSSSCDAPSKPSTTTGLTPVSTYQSTQPTTSDPTVTLAEATVLLARYTRLMAPNMPFVVIPEGTDAWELAHRKPFLMQVISTVASFHNLPKQQFMVKDLMRQISEKLILRGEKSLELLQGILILITWYLSHIIWAQQQVLLLHLAMSLTADLNIDRSPDSCEKFRLAQSGAGGPPPLPPFSNDERRAFLGTYFLTSVMSTSFKKLSALKWSPWMDDCVKTLESHAEYESDAFLVTTVRTQHLTEDVTNINSFDAPVRFLANSFQADLDAIKPPPLSGHPKTLCELQRINAHVAIWTHALNRFVDNKPKQSSELRQHIDAVWKCVEAVRSYFELYFTLQTEDALILPFQVFGQMIQATVTLLRLSTLEVDGWDLAALRDELSYSAVIGELTRRFELVETLPVDGIAIHNDAFTKFAAKTRWMKSLFDARYPSSPSSNDNNIASSADSPQQLAPPDVADGGRRWPDGLQQQQAQPGAAAMVPPGQQPTPSSDEWAASMAVGPQNVFTYFDDTFWNSFNFENFDYGGLPDVQMT